ncbi:MAG: hypothetical protein ACHQF2_08315 [Flavobacteriales bacterium]
MKTAIEKTNRYLEIFWMLVTLFAVGLAVFTIVTDGWDYGKWYIVFPLLALGMYVFRRSLRIRFERRRKEAETGGKKEKPVK